jgi:prolipoprotein diacylglyceryltransferase
MRRILFRWNGVDIHSFPAMLYFGLLAGIFVGAYFAHRTGLDADRFIAATLILLVPMMIGARLLFVATHWDLYARDLRRVWRRSEGGLSMYGGFSIAVPLSFPLLRWLELPFGAFWDAATFLVLTVLGFAKVGCLLNGWCSGRPTGAWYGLELADHHGMAPRSQPTPGIGLFFHSVRDGRDAAAARAVSRRGFLRDGFRLRHCTLFFADIARRAI